MIQKGLGNMIAEITSGGNSPKTIDQIHRGNCHAVDFQDAIEKLLSCFYKEKKILKYNNGICCLPDKHAALMSKNKDWLALNQNNVPEQNDMYTCRCCFSVSQKLRMLVWYKADVIIFHWIKLVLAMIALKICQSDIETTITHSLLVHAFCISVLFNEI